MGKTLGKSLFGAVLALIFLTALFLPGAVWAKKIKVGAAINMTGPASTWGKYHAKGLQDYFRYVNETKGGVGGRQVEIILVDTAYKVPEAVAAVRKFSVQDRVDMIATWGAGEGLAAKPIIQKYRIPTINFSTSWEILQDPVAYMYLPFGSYKMDCYAILEYIRTIHRGKNAPKVGLLTYNNAYGRSIHQPSQEYAKKIGIEIVTVEAFPPKTVDLSTELLRMQSKGVEYIFLQVLPATIVTALKNADRINYKPQFFGTWTSTDPDFFNLGKGIIRDRLAIQFPGGVPSDRSQGVKIMEELWKRYKAVDDFDAAYWEGVAVGMIMERAFVRAQERYKVVKPETINKAMESFRSENFWGLIPPVTYTPTDHGASFTARIIRVGEDGSFTPLTNFYVPGKEKIKLIQGKSKGK
ncbi:MAG: ABC transporter substrate-binding protein [Deltaproteobacteria bacterium]|nr:ABC transporter substrate-binding protein [Deltaproteobacteria bacterium]